MNITLWFGAAIAAATLSIGASAQAPAGAPAGSNGLCKDGSYSTAPKKSGACSGHKGVQTWYAAAAAAPSKPAPAAAAPSKPAPASTPTPSAAAPVAASRPAPAAPPRATPAPAPAPVATSRPAPAAPPRAAPAPAPAAQNPAPADRRTPATQVAAAPGGGPGTVWVNSASKVYHCPGTAYYGKTKAGKYVTENAAKAEGDRADAGKPCTR